jgi:hypothetical protein
VRAISDLQRRIARWRDGSPHGHFRQPLWRPLHDIEPGEIALSRLFEGDPKASTCSSKKWRKVAVVGVEPAAWSEMVKAHPDSVPALIFRVEEDPLRIGYLRSHGDLGRLGVFRNVSKEEALEYAEYAEYVGHGLSLGRFATQFTIALATKDQLITPPQELLISQGPIDISAIGRSGTNYEHMYFSS